MLRAKPVLTVYRREICADTIFMGITSTTNQDATAHAKSVTSNKGTFGVSAEAPEADASRPESHGRAHWTDCWGKRRERKTSKVVLFDTLPQIARQVKLQKRKKIVAGWTALFTGAGLISTAIGLGTSIKNPDPFAIAAIIGAGATGIGTVGLSIFTWRGIETEEYHDLVAELDEASRNPEYDVFDSDILSRYAARPTWRTHFLAQIARYKKIFPKEQAWSDIEIGSTSIDAIDADTKAHLLKDIGVKAIKNVPHDEPAITAAIVAGTFGSPVKGSDMLNFLRSYGKSAGGPDNVVKWAERCFPSSLSKSATEALHAALEKHSFTALESEMMKLAR